MEEARPHIAILSTPCMGHLIPLAEFAKQIVHHHNFSATLISLPFNSSSHPSNAFIDSLPKSINYIQIPSVMLDDLPSNLKIHAILCRIVLRSLPLLKDILKSLVSTTRLVALVVDLFAADAFDVALELGVPPYVFFTTSSMGLSFTLHLPTLDKDYSCEFRDMTQPLKLPGCVPLHGIDFWEAVQDRKNEAYPWMLHLGRRYNEAKGIFVNSFLDLEPGPIKAVREPSRPPIYPVGPLVRAPEVGSRESEHLIRWLDEQPRGSVLFVSFGSGGALPVEQMQELAFGLEISEQRFLWVTRSPSTDGSFLTIESSGDPLRFLPKGFLYRTKGVGHVVTSWGPQTQVLSHESTGGFLTHCGWNSVLESIVHGLPMIAWPLYGEQKMNAVMLVEDFKLALGPISGTRRIIKREEIARVVKCLMVGEEGKRLRKRAMQMKDAGAKALAKMGHRTRHWLRWPTFGRAATIFEFGSSHLSVLLFQ